MQSYKLVILIFVCKGYHFSIESIMKGVPFLSKMDPPRIISLTKHVFVFQVTVAGNVLMIFMTEKETGVELILIRMPKASMIQKKHLA